MTQYIVDNNGKWLIKNNIKLLIEPSELYLKNRKLEINEVIEKEKQKEEKEKQKEEEENKLLQDKISEIADEKDDAVKGEVGFNSAMTSMEIMMSIAEMEGEIKQLKKELGGDK